MIQITDKSTCCGCGACFAACGHDAIMQEEDSEGFFYPKVDKSLCLDCGLCETACPIIYRDSKTIIESTIKNFGLVNKSIEITQSSSSGGVFYELCYRTILGGGVVYGAIYNEHLHVKHARVDSIENIPLLQGSKYVQSELNGIFQRVKDDLKRGICVLFSGTPCQVEGLKLFLRKEYSMLLTVDIICHAVPSPKVYGDYLLFIEDKTKQKINKIVMRDKRKGGGKPYRSALSLENKELFDTELSNLWNKIYFSKLIDRPSCHKCRFTNFNRAGDITLGDFWGGEIAYPELFALNQGVTLCMCNTLKGLEILETIKSNFFWMETQISECSQPSLNIPTEPSSMRSFFWNEYENHSFEYLAKRYWGYGISNKTIRLIKRTMKTCIKGPICICRYFYLFLRD